MRTKKIKIKNRVIEAEVCDNIFTRARGLMFRKKSRPLLFIFKKPTRQGIHSFFCRPFLAIWMKNGKIIDEKNVNPFSISIKPKKPFTELVEMPLNNNKSIRISVGNRKV